MFKKPFSAALFASAAALLAFPLSAAEAAQRGGYGLTIPQGSEDASGRVTLNAAAPYKICLRADRAEATDVSLTVNGYAYGSYRLNARSSICLDRHVSGQSWETLPGPGWSLRLQDRISARFTPIQRVEAGSGYVYDAYGWPHLKSWPAREWRDERRAVTLELRAEAPLAPAYVGPYVASDFWSYPQSWSQPASYRIHYR